jgi:ketosteroid isomerase-like protein
MNNSRTTRDIVQKWYRLLAQKNEWQNLISEDIKLADSSLNIHEEGRIAVTKSFDQFLKTVQAVTVKHIIVENEDACAIASYDFVSPQGKKLNFDVAEIWKVRNGKLRSLTIYFDITEFRKFMGR